MVSGIWIGGVCNAAVKSQNALPAYFTSKQILHFGFARQLMSLLYCILYLSLYLIKIVKITICTLVFVFFFAFRSRLLDCTAPTILGWLIKAWPQPFRTAPSPTSKPASPSPPWHLWVQCHAPPLTPCVWLRKRRQQSIRLYARAIELLLGICCTPLKLPIRST